jgi:hypothetical protein
MSAKSHQLYVPHDKNYQYKITLNYKSNIKIKFFFFKMRVHSHKSQEGW